MEIKQKMSINFSHTNFEMNGIVLHTTLGTLESAVSHLTDEDSGVSSHFVIGRFGEITQLVDLKKMAWHAGRIYKPSERAKQILKKNIWRKGGYENPNKHLIGIEFASGYDIDRDGILEGWERLYTLEQIKSAVWLILNVIEPEFVATIPNDNILIHKDIASYKPDLEIQRTMTVIELNKQRELLKKGKATSENEPGQVERPKTVEINEMSLINGDRLKIEVVGDKVKVRKM